MRDWTDKTYKPVDPVDPVETVNPVEPVETGETPTIVNKDSQGGTSFDLTRYQELKGKRNSGVPFTAAEQVEFDRLEAQAASQGATP